MEKHQKLYAFLPELRYARHVFLAQKAKIVFDLNYLGDLIDS